MFQDLMAGTFEFGFPARVLFGLDSIAQLGTLVRELGGTRVLIVTDPGIRSAGITDRAIESVKYQSIEYFVFDGVEENPESIHLENGTRLANQAGGIDFIVGLGGGSSMDCAKGINFLLTNGGKIEDYWGFNRATKPMLPSIGIPTTAGTGSEAQSYALISQEKTHRKMACGDVKARFRAVILDPALTLTASKKVTATSGIDAISHAVETYVTTKRNPISKMFSLEAWKLLESNYERVIQEPQNIEIRAAMLLGSHFAGIAIEHSMLGAAHACANPLTAHYGIEHGIAVSLMLPAVVRFNAETMSDSYAELLNAAKFNRTSDSGLLLSQRISELRSAGTLPENLRSCGVDIKIFPELAQDAADQWTGKFNPRPLTVSDFQKLYEASY
ncbi:MAG TPA: iron-containing alcohol dehydrogenase [Acidobacteriota bacterium]|nr:iron-containing alcohol dehydrogenase [Acidobacteriota bacterium]